MSNVTALPREARSIEAPAVEGIPLADLYLSAMNPRQEADPEGIALLVRVDAPLIDQPAQHPARSLGGVGDQRVGMQAECPSVRMSISRSHQRRCI